MKSQYEIMTLGKVCKIFNGNSINADFKKRHFAGLAEGYPFIATKDVSYDGELYYNNGVRIPFDTPFKKAYPGSIFICAEGGSAGKKIARVRETVCFGNKLFCLQPQKGLLSDYLYYYLNSEAFQSQFKEKLSGLIGGVSTKKFKSIEIPIPPIEEQQSIVEYLENTLSKIENLSRKAGWEHFETVALFQTHLSQILAPQRGWKTKSLKDLSNIYGDYGLSVSAKPFDGIRYIRITDITEEGDLISEKVSAELTGDEKQTQLIESDILFARTGATVGKTLLFHEEYGKCLFAGYLIRYRLKQEEILPKFVFYVTHSDEYAEWVTANQKVAAQPNISAKGYNSLPISFPSLDEQREIVQSLDYLYDKISILRRNLVEIEKCCQELKRGVLKKVFD